MEEKKTIYNHLGAVFCTYGITVMIFVFLDLVLGEEAAVFSSLFEYGKNAMSTATLLQLFAFSVIVCVLRGILFSDRLISSLSILLRNVIFFVSVTIAIVLFVILFDWFPINDIMAWIGFVISFIVCSTAGVIISRSREKAENEKMNRALEKYRE